MYSYPEADRFWCPVAHAIVKKDGWVIVQDLASSEMSNHAVERQYKCLLWVNCECKKCGDKKIDKFLLEAKTNG